MCERVRHDSASAPRVPSPLRQRPPQKRVLTRDRTDTETKTPGISPGAISMRGLTLWGLRRRPRAGRALHRRLAVDERRDLRGHLRLEGRGLLRGELVVSDRFVDPCVRGGRECLHETVAALALVFRDVAEALAAPYRGRDA